ncbi:phenoloxidase-activating factor 2 [Folsomia candida]|uniref:Phenoloxidase-activating factor 2 n=1 Tax=Folsomia candida TaxID=158441 RepID=A0A226E6U6_FOLCA|nr:phenoloxidase-activating factor 2 [Folsomia candida]OXA53078.1 Proclotting enzyme [Folsomia candida]
MGPHLLLSKLFPHHHQQILQVAMLLLVISSCGAITTTRNKKEINSIINTTSNTTTSTTGTSTSINVNLNKPSTEEVRDGSPPKSLPILLEQIGQADLSSAATPSLIGGGSDGGRQARSSGWVWKESTEGPSSEEKNETKGVDQDEGGGAQAVGDGAEGRGYYTFGDRWTTSPYPSTSTSAGGACICVPYYLCDEGQVVTIIDIRHGWGCNSVLEVCCRNPRPTVPTVPTIPPPYPTPVPTSPPITAQPGFTPQCGTLNPNGVNARILGFKDSESQFGEYPWMAAILESKFIRGKWVLQFLCGASLITPQVVLSAAHCVKGKRVSNLIIRLGEWDTQSTNEFYPYQDKKVTDMVIHPEFYSGGLYNDIALLFLRTSSILAPHIDTICLPRSQSPSLTEYDPSSCWATGWGKNAFGPTGQYQAIMREVELAITPNDACQSALRKTNLGPNFNLHSSFICAGGQKGLDTCIGDGGGPLVCPSLYDPWRYILVGITSWGIKCGTYAVPGVYTNVPKFRSWIDSEIYQRLPYNASRWTLPLPPQGG